MSERKRSPNWNMQEKILLLDLVEEHFSVVENKKTDGVTMKQKNAEWVKISEEFNAQTMFGHRTADNLKAQWESLKKSTKKEASAARQSLIQTGGGPAKPKSSDPLFTKIMGLISTAVIGLQNEFDSDRISNYEIIEEDSHNMSASVKLSEVTDIYIPKTSNSLPHTITSSDPQETNMEESQGDIVDWGDYTPKMLQAPKSAALQSEKRENVIEMNTPQNKKTWSSKRRPALPASSLTLEDLHKKKNKSN